MKFAVVLLAHGSRDPGWAKPIEAISSAVAAKASGCVVRTAYLESMRPSLNEAVTKLRSSGVKRITIVPLFIGSGAHIKNDIPKLVGSHPGVKIVIEPPIGEQPRVIEAIAAAIARKSAPAGP